VLVLVFVTMSVMAMVAVMIVIVVDTDSDMRAAELLVSVEIDLGDLRRAFGRLRRLWRLDRCGARGLGSQPLWQ
jgi:hypothetical protein